MNLRRLARRAIGLLVLVSVAAFGYWALIELGRESRTSPTQLQWASVRCEHDLVEQILAESGQDPNVSKSAHRNALFFAATGQPLKPGPAFDCVATLDVLVSFGGDPLRRGNGDSLFFQAANNDPPDLRVFEWLTDKGLGVCDEMSARTKEFVRKEHLSELVSTDHGEEKRYLEALERSC